MLRRLRQIHASLEGHGGQMLELQQRTERLRRDLSLPRGGPDPAPDQEEVLRPLQTELRHRLQQAQELDATLSQTEGALQTAQQRLQVPPCHGQHIVPSLTTGSVVMVTVSCVSPPRTGGGWLRT